MFKVKQHGRRIFKSKPKQKEHINQIVEVARIKSKTMTQIADSVGWFTCIAVVIVVFFHK